MHFSSPVSHARKFPRGLLRAAATLGAVVLASLPDGARAQSAPDFNATLMVDSDGTPARLDLKNLFDYSADTGRYDLKIFGESLNGTGWHWAQDSWTNPHTGLPETKWVMQLTDTSFATISLVDATAKVDPFMSYAFAVKNTTGAVQTYTFIQGESIVPTITGLYRINADVGVSLTNTTSPSSGAIVGQSGLATKFQIVELSGDGGGTFFDPGVDVGDAHTILSGAGGGTTTYPSDSATAIGSTLLTLDFWQFRSTFTLTPGDSVAMTGFAEIIPEPSAYAAIFGLGVVGFVTLHRRTRFAP